MDDLVVHGSIMEYVFIYGEVDFCKYFYVGLYRWYVYSFLEEKLVDETMTPQLYMTITMYCMPPTNDRDEFE